MASSVFAVFVCIFLISSVSSQPENIALVPRSQSVNEGGTATFTCHSNVFVDCPDVKIYWKVLLHDSTIDLQLARCNEVSNSSLVGKYTVYLNRTDNGTIYTLEVDSVSSADKGNYSCYAITPDSTVIYSNTAALIVTTQFMCETFPNVSSEVTQGKGLIVGDEGEFDCTTMPNPGPSTSLWLMKGADNQTIPLNTTGRFQVSDNRLIISPLVTSDNQSLLRCTVKFHTNCGQWSPWYQIFLVAASETKKPTGHPGELKQFVGLVGMIVGIIALLVVAASVIAVAIYSRKCKAPSNRPHLADHGVGISRPAHTLVGGDLYALPESVRRDAPGMSASSSPGPVDGTVRENTDGPRATSTLNQSNEEFYYLPDYGET